jgi:hypothetical protein
MRREEKFLISHAPYAIDLEGLRVTESYATYTNPDGSSRRGDKPYYTMTVQAAWFRRKSGVLTAHFGHLWNSSSTRPADLMDWIKNAWDGRYGGDCRARWDGENLWAPEASWGQMVDYQDLLRPMLEKFPKVPAGFDGWWTYKR